MSEIKIGTLVKFREMSEPVRSWFGAAMVVIVSVSVFCICTALVFNHGGYDWVDGAIFGAGIGVWVSGMGLAYCRFCELRGV